VRSTEELQVMIQQARDRGLLPAAEVKFIQAAMELGQIQAREVMVPRPDVHALPVSATLEDTMTMFATTQRSRIPVYEGTLDHILGFVHIKDMIWILLDRARRAEDRHPFAEFNLRSVLRDALIVPETKPVSELLLEFRARRTGLAMIVDEFGSILGLATLEDILEQMVGEIHDEFDVVERPLTLPDGGMIFDAAIKIRELAARYNIMLPEDPSYETVGGFVLTRLGFIPRGGESFEADGYRFTVMEMDHRRVSRLKIKPLPPAIVPQSVSNTAPESAPKSEGVPQGEQPDPSAHPNAQAEVLEMPAPNSAADSASAKKIRRAARKKSSKASAETAVPSPEEPRPEDSPSSGPAHK
jgi:CBS domain containing-hemolysin-like protein